MLNVLKPGLDQLLTPVGRVLARTPLTPNMLTVIGTVGMTAGALSLFPTGHLFAGTMVCTGFVVADMLDGALARITGGTGVFGALLDSTMDRIAGAAVFAGIAIWLATGGHDKLSAVVALFCLVTGGLVSYAKARAEGLGLRCDVGIAERSERLLIALTSAGLAGLGVPYVLAIGLWGLAALSTVTFGQRVIAVHAATRAGPAAGTAPGTAGQGTAGQGTAGQGTAGQGTAGQGTGEPTGTSQPPAGGTR